MDLGSCDIKWEAPVTIHQFIRCEPGLIVRDGASVMAASLSGAIISVLRMPKDAAQLTRIELDEEVLGQKMSLKFAEVQQLARRYDFPQP